MARAREPDGVQEVVRARVEVAQQPDGGRAERIVLADDDEADGVTAGGGDDPETSLRRRRFRPDHAGDAGLVAEHLLEGGELLALPRDTWRGNHERHGRDGTRSERGRQLFVRHPWLAAGGETADQGVADVQPQQPARHRRQQEQRDQRGAARCPHGDRDQAVKQAGALRTWSRAARGRRPEQRAPQ